jgi:hypothetical protein
LIGTVVTVVRPDAPKATGMHGMCCAPTTSRSRSGSTKG